MTLYPTLANSTREWGTRLFENDNLFQYGNRVGHPAGNLLNDNAGHSFTYDAENRIVQVGTNVSYVYDGDGRRIRKTVSGTSTDFFYDLAGHEIAEMNSSGGWNRGEVFAGDRHIATYNWNTTFFNHLDWLGTERSRTALSGAVSETCSSLPFGDGQVCSGNETTPNHFTSKERDSETGLDYFGARFLNSSQGRWMSPDWSAIQQPIPYANLGDPQTFNLYRYVKNNPIAQADSDGHRQVCGAQTATTDKNGTVTVNANCHDEPALLSRIGAAIGRWVGMEYTTSITNSREEAAARAKMTTLDYVHQWQFQIMLGTAAKGAEIPRIGGRVPINSRYAGESHPAGVEFSGQGFPNFTPHAVAEVEVEGLTGDYPTDEKMANRLAGFSSTPDGYVWHHVEDGRTMQLIPQDIHQSARHTGGAAVIRSGGIDNK